MTAPFLIRPIMNKPSLYPQYTPTLIPQMVLPLKCSQSGLHLMISLPDNAPLMRLSANALVILLPNLSMLGESSITPLPTISLACHHKNMKKCRTEATEQFYAIVAYRRKVRDATKATHPSQTTAQRSNRPRRNESKEKIDSRSAAAGEGVRSLSKLDY